MPRKPTQTKRPIRIVGLSREPTESELDEALRAAGITGIKFTPIQLHGFLLKLVLKDRIKDKEVQLITETYRSLIKHYWGKAKAKR